MVPRPPARREARAAAPAAPAARGGGASMSLLAPVGLAALLLGPLVVALHFWHIRYRRLTVPSTLLWARLAAEVPHRRPRRLPRHYLLLALHLAVVFAGALALA